MTVLASYGLNLARGRVVLSVLFDADFNKLRELVYKETDICLPFLGPFAIRHLLSIYPPVLLFAFYVPLPGSPSMVLLLLITYAPAPIAFLAASPPILLRRENRARMNATPIEAHPNANATLIPSI
jgi:hypothetical protein